MLEQGRQWRAQEPWPWEVATQVCSCMERGGDEWIDVRGERKWERAVGSCATTRSNGQTSSIRSNGRIAPKVQCGWTRYTIQTF